MKKYLVLVLAAVLIFSFTACEKSVEEDKEQVTQEAMETIENNEDSVSTEDTTQVQETEYSIPKHTTAEYRKISSTEAKQMMDAGGVYVIDVRTKDEYNEAHINGAVLSPVSIIEEDIVNHVDNKDDVILIYCRSGNRSKTATNILVELGYTNVYDFGGIIDWTYGTVK